MAERTSRRTLWRTLALCLVAVAATVALFPWLARARHGPAVKLAHTGGRSRAEVAVTDTRAMLGAYVTLTVAAADAAMAREHVAAGFARVEELDRVLSSYSPDSEISRLNERAGRAPGAVSDDLYRAVEAGVLWYGRTQGAFDIAVAPLADLWKTCARLDRLPTPEEIARVKPLLDAGAIRLDPAARTVRFPVEGMRLDLGGHGKGYIADEVAKLLVARGVKSALVCMAGDIRAVGRKPDGAPWRIGVQDPREPAMSDAYVTAVELSGQGVSTSGNYERFVVIQGRHYSHIVDPRTGRTADDVPSVTVIGPDALTTDVLDTALSVLGVQVGLALVERLPGVEALFITRDDRNELHFTRSKGFAAFEVQR